MIFQLQCTVDELAGASPDQVEEVFSNLIDADRSGRHFFLLPRRLSNWAIAALQLSGRDFAHLNLIREQYAVRWGLLKVARAYVNVRVGGSSITFDGKGEFSIGHQRLIQGDYLLSKTCLVVEDMVSDGTLYCHIFDETKKITNVPSISVQLEHGGGTRTDLILEKLIKERKVVVCISDHDRLAPMGRKSATAIKVERIYRARNIDSDNSDCSFLGLGILTIGRELENHIPYHLFKVMERYRTHVDFDKLDELVSQVECVMAEDCFWQYFDIKKGVNGSVLTSMVNSGEISTSAFNWICAKVRMDSETIEEFCIAGFGEDVVDAFFASHEALVGFHRFVRSDYWRFMFGSYFETLLWYFAAPNRIRT